MSQHPAFGVYDGQEYHDRAEVILADTEQTATAQAHALLAIHAELLAIRALATDTINRVMGSPPRIEVTRANEQGVRVTESVSMDRIAHEARIATQIRRATQ